MAFLLTLISLSVFADQPSEISQLLVIENHQFEPNELIVPANKKIKLNIENRDSTPEEFESHELNREKLVPGKSSVTIYIGPLKAGRYPFYGEFNEKTARGVVVAQ
ncbi:MAG: cupredoxin domain-containing protein [Candidatus Methylopumilus sp.]|nr:cupredoxin domain-containing protein [Candidatus Methylopumilus sp.]